MNGDVAGTYATYAAGARGGLGRSGVAAGTSYVALLLTNRSRVTCILDGYPGVSFVAGIDAHQIGAPAERDHRISAAPLTLVPGATVHTTVEVADYLNYDQQACQPTPATGYRVFPPGSTGSLAHQRATDSVLQARPSELPDNGRAHRHHLELTGAPGREPTRDSRHHGRDG